jgi:molybdopterin/thiamine biosynthesis adenylyltransferase
VIAAALPIGRHRTPEGALCLDHPVLGDVRPMGGAEAVQRAERLWWLWENDRDALHAEEADAPDPRANYYVHEPATAVAFTDADVTGLREGEFRVNVVSLRPCRGGVTWLRATSPRMQEIPLGRDRAVLAGDFGVGGFWRRVDSAPRGQTAAEVHRWAQANAADMLDRAIGLAEIDRGVRRRADIPALVAFVYRDEGPRRDEYHDAWLFLLVRQDGNVELPRPFPLRTEERWLRQPHLEPLAGTSVAVVGLGALGSPLAALLGRAGVGRFVLCDPDIVTIGNRVRHDLDLAELGQAKVHAVASRLRRLNPWVSEIRTVGLRFGSAMNGPSAAQLQRLDDEAAAAFAGCDLIVNATAHTATGCHLARLGRESRTPVLHTWVSAGAWGGRVLVQDEGSGCPLCLAYAQTEPVAGAEPVPEVADDPDVIEVLERGCADPTFTGAGFELADAAAAAARVAVQRLLEGKGYPAHDFDLLTFGFRTSEAAQRSATHSRLPVHPDCTICQ